MRRRRKIKLNEILDMVTGSSCEETDAPSPLYIPFPKTSHSTSDRPVSIGEKMTELKDSVFKGSQGDETGEEENSIASIFTRTLTNVRKKKKK
jgi:hypothetical protein